MEYSVGLKLNLFAKDDEFPFFIQYGGHEGKVFLHSHIDFSELVIVLDGSAEHIVGSENFNVSKGDVFVMKKGTTHYYDKAKDFRICNIMFRLEDILDGDYDVKKSSAFHALFLLEPHYNDTKGFTSRLKLAPDDFMMLNKMIDETITEYQSDNPGRKTMLMSYFMMIVVRLSRIYLTKAHKHKEIMNIANAVAFMESHYMERITMNDIISVSHYSQRHFIRLFNDTYHVNPQKYLSDIRIRHACRLLRDSKLSVTNVSLQCGFDDPNYFSRVFKKYTAMSPSEFKKL